MLDYIHKAGQYDVSDQDKALNMLRLAKVHRKAGDLKAALAQGRNSATRCRMSRWRTC